MPRAAMPDRQTITIGDGMDLPIDVVTQAIAVVGKRGRGKTSTAKVLVEEMVRAGQQVIVLDTVGAWWGLRSSFDGKSEGLPVVVFGGHHADVPIEDTAGAVIATTLMRHRVPAVIDLSGFRKAGQRRFATAFIEELYHSNREPLHVVFDEADEFAPQTPFPESRALLGAMEDFVRRGRLRGLGCTLVTQRPAVIHKDVLTQVEVLITMGLTGPRDVAAIDEWVKLHATDEQAREVRTSLASLPIGTAWLWSPEWLETLRRVKVRRVTTFDSSATPKVGQRVVKPTAWAAVNVAELGEEIAATVERAREEDPKVLRQRIAALERQLSHRPAPAAAPPPELVEVPAVTAEQLTELREQSEALDQLLVSLRAELDRLGESSRELRVSLAAVHSAPPRTVRPAPHPTPRAPAPTTATGAQRAAPVAPVDGDAKLTKAQKAIASALATHGPLSARQVGLHTGYAHKSGSFANALSGLRTRGYIDGGSQQLQLTDAGHAALDANGGYTPLPSGSALVDWWLSRLPKAQAAMLSALLEVYPHPLSVDELAERTGYAASSGSFANNRSRLNVAELIHGDRTALYASDTLGGAYRGH